MRFKNRINYIFTSTHKWVITENKGIKESELAQQVTRSKHKYG